MTPIAPIGDALARSLVVALGSDCGTAVDVARVMFGRHNDLIDLKGLQIPPAGSIDRVTRDFVDRGWLSQEHGAWRVGPAHMPSGIISFLEGAAAMRAALPDDGRAIAVVTMPTAPSAIGPALSRAGLAYAALVSTEETLQQVADAAVNKLTVMTPFLNTDGLSAVIGLFRRTRAVEKRLIIRRAGGARNAVQGRRDQLVELGIEVLDYTLSAGSGFETFHAKVALADQDIAYVGSANMTVFARHSMELGILVDGRAARVIANVVRGIERIAVSVIARVS